MKPTAPEPLDDGVERTVALPRPVSVSDAPAPLIAGHTLPVGTRLLDYEISGLVGEGGFGIVYLAYDRALERHVAIKEYMPASMATRVPGSSAVRVSSERHAETFRAGLKSFINEARLLARFDHPALVKVYRFWEANGTAYMVMPFYEGRTLQRELAAAAAIDEATLRGWLEPLLDALETMHAAHCFHRDIAPDNILLTSTGPLLLDFGAARRVIGDMTHALTVVLKPGYAPIEQYGDVATMAQGAWTDLYALACVIYFAVTGNVPMSSVERLMDDRLVPLARIAGAGYGASLLAAVDAALAVRPQDRPQSVAEFRALLNATGEPARRVADIPLEIAPKPADGTSRRRRRSVAGAAAAIVLLTLGVAALEPFEARRPGAAREETGAVPGRPASSIAASARASTEASAKVSVPIPPPPTTLDTVRGGAAREMPIAGSDPPPHAATSRPASVGAETAAAPDPESAPGARPRLRTNASSLPRNADAPRAEQAPRTRLKSEPVAPIPSSGSPTAATSARPPVTHDESAAKRCAEVLQKASLEPLTSREVAYLKRECQ